MEATKKFTPHYVKVFDLMIKKDFRVYTEKYVSEEGQLDDYETRLVFEAGYPHRGRACFNFRSEQMESLAVAMMKYKDKPITKTWSQDDPETLEGNVFHPHGHAFIIPVYEHNTEEWFESGFMIRLQSDDADWSEVFIDIPTIHGYIHEDRIISVTQEIINDIGTALMKVV